MWSYMMNGGWYAWGLAGMLLHMVLWGAFIVAVAYFIIRIQRGAGGCNRKDNALDILKERYAKGEISEDEFLSMKEKIK